MTSIQTLAVEFHAQPYELQAFADLGHISQSDDLDSDTEVMIREAWALQADLQQD